MANLKRDPATERLWFSITEETHDEHGAPFARPNAAVRHHGEIVAYYGGWGPPDSARICALESIEDRVKVLCGIAIDDDYPSCLDKGPEDA